MLKHYLNVLRYQKEGKFNFKVYGCYFCICQFLEHIQNEAFLKTEGKNCFMVVAILWYSESTLIHYLHNVVYYIMIFFSSCYKFILQLRKQIMLVPKSGFFP